MNTKGLVTLLTWAAVLGILTAVVLTLRSGLIYRKREMLDDATGPSPDWVAAGTYAGLLLLKRRSSPWRQSRPSPSSPR